VIEIEPLPGHEFDFSAMFDRINHPANGRDGGMPGAAGKAALDDGTVLQPKGWQHVPEGRRLVLHLPGGGGFGDPARRDPKARANDLAKGYVTEVAK
jgi:N-methylhydantoinase B